VQLAMECVDDVPDRRPSMREVVKRLYIADCEDGSSSEISNEVCLSRVPANFMTEFSCCF
jgi:hypothetical protein